MTDPIEEARALLDYWRSIGWDDDAPAMVKVLALAAECERLRAGLAFERVTVAELRLEAHQLRTNLHLERITLAEAKAEADELHRERTRARNEVEALAAECGRLRAELAAAREAMPTEKVMLVLHAIVDWGGRNPSAQERDAAIAALDAIDAYRASQAKEPSGDTNGGSDG